MDAFVLLTLISVIGAAALFLALAVYLRLIVRELQAIGGTPTSFLAKIRFGLRAIETATVFCTSGVCDLVDRIDRYARGVRPIGGGPVASDLVRCTGDTDQRA